MLGLGLVVVVVVVVPIEREREIERDVVWYCPKEFQVGVFLDLVGYQIQHTHTLLLRLVNIFFPPSFKKRHRRMEATVVLVCV